MKTIILAALLASATAAHADAWTGADKDKHAIAGMLVSASVAAATRPAYGIAAGCAVGVAKEVYDRHTPGHQVSVKDAAVTCAGSVLGAYVPGIFLTRRTVGIRWSF